MRAWPGKIEKQHELRNNPRYKRDDTILKNGVEYSFGNTQQQTQQIVSKRSAACFDFLMDIPIKNS